MNNDLDKTAMSIILHAGNAREEMKNAVDALIADNLKEYEKRMLLAKEKIRDAHKSQTEVIQQQARGDKIEINLLFIHAQDTLMTIMSEENMVESIKKIYDKLQNEIATLKKEDLS